jgi:hypothetical protein
MSNDIQNSEYWKAIILYGLNSATLKIALGKTLLDLAQGDRTIIPWYNLAESYLNKYIDRLGDRSMPQQPNPSRLSVPERIVTELRLGKITITQAVDRIGKEGFKDVIPRFQTIGFDTTIVGNRFYSIEFGKSIILHDPLFEIAAMDQVELLDELEARWSLLEGAYQINHSHWDLSNDVRDIYLTSGYNRTNLTYNNPFLQGYQGNTCFYCGEPMQYGDIHVDHVLPRQVVQHDEIWNLVLSHGYCNMSKSDHLVGPYYMNKLIARNENIMGSNHPWKRKIETALGSNATTRGSILLKHYENVKKVIGLNYWGGIKGYIPEHDPFYRKLITRLNNG